MGGGDYICGKRGAALISEALQRLQLSQFLETDDISRFLEIFTYISELHTLFEGGSKTPASIKSI